MKVSKSFTVEGNIVTKVFQKGNLSVYQMDKDYDAVLYFVDTKTDVVLFKQEVNADCNQNTGFISNISFTEVE